MEYLYEIQMTMYISILELIAPNYKLNLDALCMISVDRLTGSKYSFEWLLPAIVRLKTAAAEF